MTTEKKYTYKDMPAVIVIKNSGKVFAWMSNSEKKFAMSLGGFADVAAAKKGVRFVVDILHKDYLERLAAKFYKDDCTDYN